MKARILTLTCLILMACKSQQPVVEVPVKTLERKVTRLIPIYMPGDSALLRVWLECDSMNNVLLKGLEEQKSPNMASDISFNDGVLEYGTKTLPDTVYLPSDSIYIENDVPVYVEVEKEVNVLTGWQRTRMRVGDIALAILLLFGAWQFMKLKFKIL